MSRDKHQRYYLGLGRPLNSPKLRRRRVDRRIQVYSAERGDAGDSSGGRCGTMVPSAGRWTGQGGATTATHWLSAPSPNAHSSITSDQLSLLSLDDKINSSTPSYATPYTHLRRTWWLVQLSLHRSSIVALFISLLCSGSHCHDLFLLHRHFRVTSLTGNMRMPYALQGSSCW
jgi:hypothetical protein